tara:strand:- start:66 stop:851 length:786 start_codon:yes stop_codon:yes gene_type:complete
MTILLIIILLLLVFLCKRKKENFQESLVHYPIYWINLDRSINRKKWIEKNFKKLGIHKHNRIPAVDGKKLGMYNLSIPQEYYSNHSKNELACTSSHLKCIEQAYNNRDNIAIICEDDVCFSLLKAVDKSLQEIINKCPRDWEIIQLGQSNPDKMKLLLKEKKEYVKWNKNYWGAFCYVINRKGINKMYNSCFMNNNINIKKGYKHRIVADELFYNICKTYTLTKPVITFKTLGSTLHTQHEKWHESGKKSLLKYYNIKNLC